MGHGGRARLAKTCGTRDESPSSNLGRGKQGEAIRADRHNPQINGTHRDVMARRQRTRRAERERICSVRFLVCVKVTELPRSGMIGCTDAGTAGGRPCIKPSDSGGMVNDKPKEASSDKSSMECFFCIGKGQVGKDYPKFSAWLTEQKQVVHEPSASAIEEAGWIFPDLRTDGRPQRWGHQRRGGIHRVDSDRQRASVHVCHRGHEQENSLRHSHDGLLCSGRETADLVKWVYDGFRVRRAIHERSMLDCRCVHA